MKKINKIKSREIKFRAWTGKQMETDFTVDSDGTIRLTTYCGDGAPTDIVKWELMQYTGIKDKNDKPIYEGDIIEGVPIINPTNIKLRGFVFFDNRGIWKVQIPGMNDEQDIEYLFEICKSNNPEIIGNIYENPNLLEW